jgi:hypothetical protein
MAAPGGSGWLSLGAAPMFALMALWTGLFGQPDGLCRSVPDALSLNGMALMYTLMSIFHAPPWMKFVASQKPAPSRVSPGSADRWALGAPAGRVGFAMRTIILFDEPTTGP